MSNLTTDSTNGRSPLRFSEEVTANFAFLGHQGFRCVRAEPTFVRFESPEFCVSIYHGRKSYEIGLEIGHPHSTTTYSFSEILRLHECDKGSQHRNLGTHTVNGVAEGVRQLAAHFRDSVEAGLFEERDILHRLKLQREEWAQNYALEVQLAQARRKADDAWKQKDFAQVIKFFAPLQEHLGPVEQSKLQYAQKHLKR